MDEDKNKNNTYTVTAEGVSTIDINGSFCSIDVSDTSTMWSTDSTVWSTITATQIETLEQKQLKQVVKDVDAIKERLAILDEPSPEKLEQYKMLKEAYLKYKMIEKLIGERNVGTDGPK